MKKSLILIIILIVSTFTSACQKFEEVTIEFDNDIIELYHEDLTNVFGDYQVVNKERITDGPLISKTRSVTYIYDEWEFEFTDANRLTHTFTINNRIEVPSQIKFIILETIKINIFDKLQWKFRDPLIQFENGFEQIDLVENIPDVYYPINLDLSKLPKTFLIVILINLKDIQDYRLNIDGLINDIETLKLINALILYEDEAYYMNHGLFYHDQKLISSSIKVEDTLKWINDNQ